MVARVLCLSDRIRVRLGNRRDRNACAVKEPWRFPDIGGKRFLVTATYPRATNGPGSSAPLPTESARILGMEGAAPIESRRSADEFFQENSCTGGRPAFHWWQHVKTPSHVEPIRLAVPNGEVDGDGG